VKSRIGYSRIESSRPISEGEYEAGNQSKEREGSKEEERICRSAAQQRYSQDQGAVFTRQMHPIPPSFLSLP